MNESNIVKQIGKMEEMIYTQTKIISMQSGIIDEQFRFLCKYLTHDDFDRYPLFESMKDVEILKKSIGE